MFFQAEDGIRDVERSRGLGDVYKRQAQRVRIYERILKSAESYVPRAARVDRRNNVTSFKVIPDTIDETQPMLFSDTGDLVDETSSSQYDLNLG